MILCWIMEMPIDKDFHHLSHPSTEIHAAYPKPWIFLGGGIGIGHTLKFLWNIEGITCDASHTRMQSWLVAVYSFSRYKKHVRLAKLLRVAPQGITS